MVVYMRLVDKSVFLCGLALDLECMENLSAMF